jgi:hypothetical protein
MLKQMLEGLNKGQAPTALTNNNVVEQMHRMNTGNGNIVMNVASEEESVEELIRKLHERGTKVKILKDDEDPNHETPKQSSTKKAPTKSPSSVEANKENKPAEKPTATAEKPAAEAAADPAPEAAVPDDSEKVHLEELKKQNEEIAQIKEQQQ